MLEFLSEENISLHKEYYRNLKHKFSILEKSIPNLSGKTLNELYELKLSRQIRTEAIALKREIYLHEVYFSSFTDRERAQSSQNTRIRAQFGSWQSFVFEAYMLARELEGGFLVVYEGKDKIELVHSEKIYRLPRLLLALDLCEHAYFLDYRFGKDDYLKLALLHFDDTKIK